jgi:hypothetical protein
VTTVGQASGRRLVEIGRSNIGGISGGPRAVVVKSMSGCMKAVDLV